MGKTIEDYSDLVKEKHALNKTIAPVETNETDASRAYVVGEQLILSGILYDVIAAISEHDVITTTGSGANIAPAGPISAKIQTLTNNVKARAELSAYNLLNIFNSEINTNGTYTEVINSDGTVTIGGTPTSACTIPYKATAKYNGNVYNLKPNTDYVLDSGLSAISPLNLQVFVKENSGSSWAKIAEATVNTKLVFTTPASFYDIWVRILVPANAVVPADTIVKPMIVLASDITIGFVPYAMTNRKLTDSIVNSYVFKGTDTITVTAEANDTWDTMIEKSRVAINNYLANLEDNEYVRFIALSGAYSGISQIYDLKKKNDAVSGAFLVNGFTNSYATGVLTLIRIASSNKAAIRTTFSTSTGESSTTSVLSDSFTSGLTLTYLIDKFVKIQ